MAVAPKGIDVRAALGGKILFRASLKDSTGAKLITGTTNLSLYELQDDGTLKTYDFADNTFKATAVTTEQQAMTVRKGNNNTTDLGLWTFALTTLTNFTVGAVYFAVVANAGASPPQQEREFQFGGDQGDLPVSSTGYYQVDVIKVTNSTTSVANFTKVFLTDFASNYVNAVGWGNVALTATERTSIAAAVELAIFNDGDATALLAAIAAKVETFLINEGDASATLAAIAAAVRTNLATELARLDVTISSRLATAGYTVPPNTAQIVTAVLTELVASANFNIANSFGKLIKDNLDVPVSSRLATAGYTAPPDISGLATLANQLTIIAKTNLIPATPANEATVNAVGVLVSAIKALTDRLIPMLVNNAGDQFTSHALELAPAGGGGGGPIGPGASENILTFQEAGNPVADADVWLTIDSIGENVVAGTLQTNSEGKITFLLDPGVTYYIWMQKDGFNSILGQAFEAE